MYPQRTGRYVLLLVVLLALGNGVLGSAINASASAGVGAVEHGPVRVAPRTVATGVSALKREVFGFALASSLSDPTVGYTTWNFSLLTTVAFFGLHVQDDGTFAADNSKTVWDSTQVGALVSTAHAHGTRVVLTIVLQDFGAGTPHMCSGLGHTSTTVAAAVAEVKAKGMDGLNVDYEGLNGSCGTADPSWARHAMTSFAAALRSALPAGSYLSIDTYASSATDPIGFFDVAGVAPSVDSFFVMAYDLEYANYKRAPLNCTSFCLGPTAPLTGYYYNDTSTASQYASVVPAGKVILGVPYYGRKACVASGTPNQYPTPSTSVVADSYLDAAGESGAPQLQPGSFITHRDANDPAGQEAWDTWFNTSLNCTRELYWDDATSLGLKYDLVLSDNLRGVGIWNLNYGGGAPELWSELATHFALLPGVPGNASACSGNASATVSWTPAPNPGPPVTSYQVTASPGGASASAPGDATIATVTGLTAGTAYTFSIQAVNSAGAGVAASTGAVTPTAAPPSSTAYLNWYDNASPGMVNDNIHILDTGGTPNSGCVIVSGRAVASWAANPGLETHVTMPPGTMGGPVLVTVNSGPPVLVSQRVQYHSSFNELLSEDAAQASTTSYFNWFDNASPGMASDAIHVQNPGGTAASVTVGVPGATPLTASVGAGSEAVLSFPKGTIGGPVTVSASQPVLASQRVVYNSSFDEGWAMSAAQAATTSYFNWYDKASPGMIADNIHLLNPGATAATVSVGLPGTSPKTVSVAPGAEAYVTFPQGTIGGPVKVSSTQPVLASQRVQYYQSFNETSAMSGLAAATLRYFNWYDKASPGMFADNVHLLNPGAASASVTVSYPGGSPITVSVASGAEAYVTFPQGSIGGPVKVASTQPVFVAQRVVYYQSFDEIPGG